MKAKGTDKAIIRHVKEPMIVDNTAPRRSMLKNAWRPSEIPKILSVTISLIRVEIRAGNKHTTGHTNLATN